MQEFEEQLQELEQEQEERKQAEEREQQQSSEGEQQAQQAGSGAGESSGDPQEQPQDGDAEGDAEGEVLPQNALVNPRLDMLRSCQLCIIYGSAGRPEGESQDSTGLQAFSSSSSWMQPAECMATQ